LTAIWHKVKNNAASELAVAITAGATGLTLKTGEGSRFPAGFPYHITIDDEIMAVTARTDDTLTVTRAQESTSPAAHNAGAAVRLNITAALIEELQTQIDTKEEALPLTTKGDLLVYAAVLARLGVGSDGQYLVADSGEATGMKWQNLSGGSVVASGSYTGDGTSNRAIPHGLGVVPKAVFICCTYDNGAIGQGRYSGILFLISSTGYQLSYYGDTVTVTAMNITNFYVKDNTGGELNNSGKTYCWISIG
jgi:hypothetical protein